MKLPLNIENGFGFILENDPAEFCNIEVEVLNEPALLGVPNIPISDVIHPNVQVQDLQINPNGEVTIIGGIPDDAIHFSDLSESFDSLADAIDMNPTFEIVPVKRTKTQDEKPKKIKTNRKIVTPKTVVPKQKKSPLLKIEKIDDNKNKWLFIQWLASVTERINQTMHYQFEGKPEPLIFHVPQVSDFPIYRT